MPKYEAAQIRNAFEILRRAGWLDRVQEELKRKEFTVEISDKNSEVLRDLIVAAVDDLAKREPGALKDLPTGKSGRFIPTIRHSDCPC